jgi:tetratricopeptide (TPR) repeat protein
MASFRDVRSLLVGLLLLAGSLSALAEWGVVITKDGRELTGDIDVTDDGVRIRQKGITQTIPQDNVDEVRFRPTVDEQYRQRAAALRPDDADGWYRLAEWARMQGRYDLVYRAVQRVLASNPDHENAILLKRLAERKLREQMREQKPEEPRGRSDSSLLSADDIQRIRLAEFHRDGSETRVRVRFAKDFLDTFLDAMGGEPELATRETQLAFRRASATDQLALILRMSERVDHNPFVYADQVEILDDPAVFRTFRTQILPLVLRNCATSVCHGTAGPARLRLIHERALTPPVVYTDFLLLDDARTNAGRVIDRDNPQASLLLQYGLPPEIAQDDHPELPRSIRPMLRNRRDPNYRRIRDWISSLQLPHPAYNVHPPAGAGQAPPAPPAAERAEGEGGAKREPNPSD